MKAIQYTKGQKINGLTFIKEIDPYQMPSRSMRMGRFECSCGNLFDTIIRSVVTKNTKSCGCYGYSSRSKRFTTHGLINHPLYSVWCTIKSRCYNKKRLDFKYYGKIGVVLSDEFHDFKKWFDYVTMLPRYKDRERLKLTIDRINPKGNYQRGNLRWATRQQQALNQRRNSAY